ncbi:MAG: hypothetical protein H3C31_12100 [Brumimicrobium sp.]|nr:hypothetical protein [Brumimicrobium sp.]MCO5267546.1 hypothetical protein [Brumimicrobium sp.]
MQQKLFLFILGVLMLTFASCKKDYTCTCNEKVYPIQKSTKQVAKRACEDWGKTYGPCTFGVKVKEAKN